MTRDEIIEGLKKCAEAYEICGAFMRVYGNGLNDENKCCQRIKKPKEIDIFRSAAELLENAEPKNRVLTLEELCESADAADWIFVWIESKINPYDVSNAEQVCPWYKTGKHFEFAHVAEDRKTTRKEIAADFGKKWRCWLRKPTEKEMAES